MSPRTNIPESLSTFAIWLLKNPVDGDRIYSTFSVRYQVSRYCEYLATNPWPGGDPLGDAGARDGAVRAYRAYLTMFNTPAAAIDLISVSLDRFYVFLGLGPPSAEDVEHGPDPSSTFGDARHSGTKR